MLLSSSFILQVRPTTKIRQRVSGIVMQELNSALRVLLAVQIVFATYSNLLCFPLGRMFDIRVRAVDLSLQSFWLEFLTVVLVGDLYPKDCIYYCYFLQNAIIQESNYFKKRVSKNRTFSNSCGISKLSHAFYSPLPLSTNARSPQPSNHFAILFPIILSIILSTFATGCGRSKTTRPSQAKGLPSTGLNTTLETAICWAEKPASAIAATKSFQGIYFMSLSEVEYILSKIARLCALTAIWIGGATGAGVGVGGSTSRAGTGSSWRVFPFFFGSGLVEGPSISVLDPHSVCGYPLRWVDLERPVAYESQHCF
jgi:hypothetical protein